MNFIRGVGLILFSIIYDQSRANPCEDQGAKADIWETHPFTDKMNVNHCFFLLSDTIVNTTLTIYQPPWASQASLLLNKTKCQEVCGVYGAYLPILVDKEIFETFWKIINQSIIGGEQPLGVNVKNEVGNGSIEVEWDNGVKGQIDANGIYGTTSHWICCYINDGDVILFDSSTGAWETAEYVSSIQNFSIFCHYNPNHIAPTIAITTVPVASTTPNLTTMQLSTTDNLNLKVDTAPSAAQALGTVFWKPIFYTALFYAVFVSFDPKF